MPPAASICALNRNCARAGSICSLTPDQGAWRRHLLLVGPDSVSVQLISEPTIRISSWDQFDEIVLVATSAERTGLAYQHLFTAQFDPDLIDRRGQPPSPPCSNPTTPTRSAPANIHTPGWRST